MLLCSMSRRLVPQGSEAVILQQHRIADSEDILCERAPDDAVTFKAASDQAVFGNGALVGVNHHQARAGVENAIFEADSIAVTGGGAVSPVAEDQVDMGTVIKHVPDGPMDEIRCMGVAVATDEPPDPAVDMAAAGATPGIDSACRLDVQPGIHGGEALCVPVGTQRMAWPFASRSRTSRSNATVVRVSG